MDDLDHLESLMQNMYNDTGIPKDKIKKELDSISMLYSFDFINDIEEEYDEGYLDDIEEEYLDDIEESYSNNLKNTKPKIKRIAVAIDATQQFFIENNLQNFINQLPEAYEYHVITFDTCILDMAVFNNKNDLKKITNNVLIGSGPYLSVVKDFIIHNKYNEIHVFSDGYFVDQCDKSNMIFYSPKLDIENKTINTNKEILIYK